MIQNKYQSAKFTPFTHENLDFKNELIEYARGLKGKEGLENQLAATFIYVSFSEYLANNLLEHLKYFIYQGSYDQFAGILFIDERKKSGKAKTLGQICSELEKYNFPDKQGIVTLLQEIKELRNNLFHNFAIVDLDGLEKMIQNDVIEIQNKTEELLRNINVIYDGLQKILAPQSAPTEESGKQI